MNKRILLVISIVLVLLAIPLTLFLVKRNQDIRQRAAPSTTLEFSPQSLTVSEGEQFSLDIVVTTGPNQVTGADITVVFDPDKLEAESIIKGSFLPNVLVLGDVGPGTASIALGAPSTTPGSGTGTIATVSFKALATSTTPISVRFAQPDTQLVGLDEGGTNLLVGTTPAAITVSGSGGTGGADALASEPTAAPTTSPTTLLTTTVTSPTEGATTISQPTISGITFSNALLTITITATNPITEVVSAGATGSWSFTPSSALAQGTHTITVTAQDPQTEEIETVTRSFVVQGSSTTQSSSSSGVPVAGSLLPTFTMLGIGSILFVFGALAFVL